MSHRDLWAARTTPTTGLAADLLADARSYVSRTFGGIDLADMPEATVRASIEQLYAGGWEAYAADFLKMARQLGTQARTEAMSPVKVKIFVEHMIGRKLREYDEVLKLDKSDLAVTIVTSRAAVERRARRDVITSRTITLYKFTREAVGTRWGCDSIEYSEPCDEAFVRFGSVTTPERAAAMIEQVETCYRPGTESAPMAGWVARAGISHRQAHPEVYPKSYDQ